MPVISTPSPDFAGYSHDKRSTTNRRRRSARPQRSHEYVCRNTCTSSAGRAGNAVVFDRPCQRTGKGVSFKYLYLTCVSHAACTTCRALGCLVLMRYCAQRVYVTKRIHYCPSRGYRNGHQSRRDRGRCSSSHRDPRQRRQLQRAA